MAGNADNPQKIYLDQNGWIALSRAFYGKDDTGKYEAPMRAVIAASEADRIRVPLSFNHLIEVCASGEMGRRKRLATFMVKVSRQYAIVPFMVVRHEEVFEAMLRRFDMDNQVFNRDKLVQRGLWFALGTEFTLEGGQADQRAMMDQIIRSDAMAIKMLSEWMSSDKGRTLREQSEGEAEFLDKIRHSQLKGQGAAAKRRADTLAVAKEMVVPLAEEEFRKMGGDPAKLHEKLLTDDDLIAFAHDAPSFDVLLSLMLARDEEAQRKIDRNDMRDMGFMATAIPYCDVVVVEQYFGNLAKRLGLDKKYGCTILTDVADLTDILPKPAPVAAT